jgi:hypothetical protein
VHHRNNLQIKSFGGQVGFCCSCSAVLRAACRKCLSPKLLRQGRSQVVAPYPGVINIREALMDGLSGCAQTVPMSTCNLQGLFLRDVFLRVLRIHCSGVWLIPTVELGFDSNSAKFSEFRIFDLKK